MNYTEGETDVQRLLSISGEQFTINITHTHKQILVGIQIWSLNKLHIKHSKLSSLLVWWTTERKKTKPAAQSILHCLGEEEKRVAAGQMNVVTMKRKQGFVCPWWMQSKGRCTEILCVYLWSFVASAALKTSFKMSASCPSRAIIATPWYPSQEVMWPMINYSERLEQEGGSHSGIKEKRFQV